MTDDLEPVRRLRPDRLQPDDPPDPEILTQERQRLMATIAGTPKPTPTPTPTPTHTEPTTRLVIPSIYPRLAYRDEAAALEFLVGAFGFRERREARMEHPEGMLAWLEVGDGVVMIGRAGSELHDLHSPADTGQNTAMINVYVDDVDAHYRQAVAHGARVVMELSDMFWGDRRYEALDLEGHRWHFAERLAHLRQRLDPETAPVVAPAAAPGQAPVANPPGGLPRVLPHLIYEDVAGAVAMLTRVFGFRERTAARHTSSAGTVGRTQLQVADGVITLGQPSIHGDSPRQGVSSMLYIYVDDVEAHYRRARAEGATIVSELATLPWGDRRYQATDLEGHQWTFAQHLFEPDEDHHQLE